MQTLSACNNLCAGAKTIVYGIVINIGATKHLRMLYICYIYLVMVWSSDDLVHVQFEIVWSSLRLLGRKITLRIILGMVADIGFFLYYLVFEKLQTSKYYVI